MTHLELTDGAHVATVGGGPAGSFFAIHVLAAARQAGRQLAVTIFEPKTFSAQGPTGCNMSAGILSPSLLSSLAAAGLRLPPEVQMGRIDRFALHLAGQVALVPAPGSGPLPVTVYRGGGPQRAEMDTPVSFDGWLLAEAVARGATVIHEYVESLDFGPARPEVRTASGRQTADLVVLATGANGRLPELTGLAYRPPRTERMAQGEMYRREPTAAADSPATAHVFLDGLAGLVFAALVPKGRFVSISILGRELPGGSVRRFVADPEVQAVLREPAPRLCGCRPQIIVQAARGVFADRFVAVGDAAVTRLYKDGIGSAFHTAQAAAQTAVRQGVGARDLAGGYAPTCRAIESDNRFGRLLFSLWARVQRSPRLGRAVLAALATEGAGPEPVEGASPELVEGELPVRSRHWQPALWAILSGDASYRAIARRLFHPAAAVGLAKAWAGADSRAIYKIAPRATET